MRILEVRGLQKSFAAGPRERRVQALRGVDFYVDAGEVVGLIGPNGAGKSTLLLAIAGMLAPEMGQITLFGTPVRLCMAEDVGYAPERSAFHEALTLRETLLHFSRLRWDRNHATALADAAIRNLRLAEHADKRVTALSRGILQRLAVAQAMLGNPKLLLLDESLSGVDAVAHRELRVLIGNMPAYGTSVVLSSHDLAAVERVATRVVVLIGGAVRASIDARELQDSRGLEDRFFELVEKHVVTAPT